MRPLIGRLIPFILILITLIMIPMSANSQQVFITNTPRPSPVQFITNTPRPSPTATFTPSNTPTNTATPTATFTATSTPTATFTPSNTPSPTPTPNGPFVYPEGVNPLTGLPYPDEASMLRRNLIVKISNYPPIVRPQSGVNQADIVFEYEAEGGVTRFAGIFRSNMPDRVGPVRSGRLLDMELIVMYNALLAYSGTSEPIQNLILGSEWVFRAFSPLKGDNCENAGFCRDQDLLDAGVPLEHTMFLDTTRLYDLAGRRNVNNGFQARGFAFSEIPQADGMEIPEVYLDWYGQADARWQYVPDTGRYVRFSDDIPHMDAVDGEQLWANNLVVIEVPHNERPDLFPEGASYASLEVALWEQGRAYVFRDGVFYQGYWRRQNDQDGSALQLIFGDNTPILLHPGRTWISIVRGLGANVSLLDDYTDMGALATEIALTPTATPIPNTDND